MLNIHMVHRTIAHLRWTFIQRLIILIISTLLAVCLGSTTLVIVSMHEIARSHASIQYSQFTASAAPLGGGIQLNGLATDWTRALLAGSENTEGRL